jgi:N-sulfoglucosamine sulfohydrolase
MRNILLMIADDLGRMAGCYGESAIATPNIDRLAGEGTRFDMAFTSTASCSASRSVIYTGLHTHETGQYGLHHDHHHFMTFGHVETAPALFNRAGYRTGIIGKVHVGPADVYPWNVREESGSRDVAWAAGRAEAFLDAASKDGQSFFLTVGFIDPHRDMTRSGFGNDGIYPGIEDRLFSPEEVSVPPFLPDLPEVRLELAEYYRSVYRLDQGVGLVLAALERAGLADDTLVCFLSDNGSPFLNSKTTLYDAGVHLPLILRKPGGKPGIAGPNLVSFTDILPTFLDWAGLIRLPVRVVVVRCCRSSMKHGSCRTGSVSSVRTHSTKSPITGRRGLCARRATSIIATLPGSSIFRFPAIFTVPFPGRASATTSRSASASGR